MKTEARTRIRIAALAIAILFTALTARLWQLQIIQGGVFRTMSIENRLRIEKVPAPRGIIYDRNGTPLVKNSPFYSVSIQPGMLGDADLERISDFLNIDMDELYGIIDRWGNPLEPIKLKDGLSFAEVAYIEARISDYPSLNIEVEQSRHYLNSNIGSHLIGYLGKLNPAQIKKEDFRDIPRQALVGQWGVEKIYDGSLRGSPGRRVIEVDALGRKLRKISEDPPVRGNDLYLSIDINLQKEAEEAFGARMGAFVAVKPTTGEILGLVSRPSFDPNLFTRGIGYEDWISLSGSKGYPMLNRALQSQYPPGSTFKIITALAALESDAVTSDTEVTCRGLLSHGPWSFRCWKRGGHGTLSMHRALVESCDVYFYTVGRMADIDNIAKYARLLGLGTETGLGLADEKRGLVPDREWKKRVKNEIWFPGETYNASIGQGFVLATPAQLARMISTIANGGRLYGLRLTRAETTPEPLQTIQLSDETLKIIKDALSGVVAERGGTGYASRSRKVSISGKTGTSQVIAQKEEDVDEEDIPLRFRDHAWFVAYAPSDRPEIAMSVFVEHGGHGGTAAAPIAKQAIEAYFAKTEGPREN
jgi:penicillin-binding protein 2